jgi:hypothetical membrane protein
VTASSVFVDNLLGCSRRATISKTSIKGQIRHGAFYGYREDYPDGGYNQPVSHLFHRKETSGSSRRNNLDVYRSWRCSPNVMDAIQGLSFLVEHFELFGILASLIILAALSIPIPMYTGRAGEKYSVLNHFVSELGEVGVSRGAKVFNEGLVAAGVLFIPFTLGLGFSIQNLWAKFGMIAGIWTAVWLLLIGVFPMNNLKPHIIAALSFFDGGLATILFFTVGLWMQPVGTGILPRVMPWIGVVCILIDIVFLTLNPRPSSDIVAGDFLRLDPLKNRPRIWMMPISEWLVVFVSTLWYLSTALVLLLS